MTRGRATNPPRQGVRAWLLRVGADSTADGGCWNAPVDAQTGRFAYVPIPESRPVRPGEERPYSLFEAAVGALNTELPRRLRNRDAHLDPDFEHLTYGDRGQRGRQLLGLAPGDILAFYAGLRDIGQPDPLVYALIGLYTVAELVQVRDVAPECRSENAHTRRQAPEADEIVVRARRAGSGRLSRCIAIGTYRDRAYRVHREILDAWGGISHRDGWISRGGRIAEIGAADLFMNWFEAHDPTLLARNN